MKHVTGSEVLEVGMMKHISYIATSVDDDKTGKTKTVRFVGLKGASSKGYKSSHPQIARHVKGKGKG